MEMLARTWKSLGTSTCYLIKPQQKQIFNFCFISRRVAAAIGETLESVCAMQDKERKEPMEVLGFKVDIFVFL